MSTLGYILFIVGILIILVVITVIITLVILVLANRCKKFVFYDKIDAVSLKKYKKADDTVEKFVNTDWEVYKNALNTPPPEELVAFYKNKDLIFLHNYMVKLKDSTSTTGYQFWEVGKYMLPEEGILKPQFALTEGEKPEFPDIAFCFAEDQSGNVYYIIPSTEQQYKVFYYDKESNTSTEVALLKEFLNESRFCFEL